MPTEVAFAGRKIVLPGVYTTTKSGIKNPPLSTPYGEVMVIDTGQGAGFAGGAGIAGEQSQGLNSVYVIDTVSDFQSLCRGGIYWKLAELLFFPCGRNSTVRGASRVYFVKAAATTAASLTLPLSATTITIKTKSEGLAANGELTGSNLSKGYGLKLNLNALTSKYFFTFYLGNYKGIDPGTNLPYDGITAANSTPELIFTSPEFASVAEFLASVANNGQFAALFSATAAAAGTTAIATNEANSITGFQNFIGATETYSSGHYDTVLSKIEDINNSFFLAPDHGTSIQSAYNTKLMGHINNEARFQKFLIAAGGSTSADFKGVSTASVESAAFFNSDKAVILHGGYQEKNNSAPSLINRTGIFMAAKMLGRIAGLETQIPATFKVFPDIKGLTHQLTKAEREFALKSGLTTLINDPELGFCVLQAVTSIQRNSFLINEDGSSFSLTLKRIEAQLNKEIVINAKKTFFGTETGFNRNSASPEDVRTWLIGFLQTKIATQTTDNLIIRFQNVQVRAEGDNYYASYEFVPNFEVNKVFITGTIIES